MTEAFDTASAELVREIECHEHEISLLSNKLLSQQIECGKCVAHLQGMDRAWGMRPEAARMFGVP